MTNNNKSIPMKQDEKYKSRRKVDDDEDRRDLYEDTKKGK